MGAMQVEINIHCPYCCKKQKCEGFQEIENLRDTGWVIYCHTDGSEYENQAGEDGKSISIPQNVFILCNRKKKKMADADFLAQLDKNRIPCPRCRLKLEHAQRLINKRLYDETSDVIGVCDHCLLKTKIEESCYKCAKIVKKFLAARGEQENDTNKYFKSWVTKIEHKLNEELPKIKPQKKLQRSYSDINISLLSRDTSKTFIKCKVQEMFHSEVNLLDTNRKEKIKQPRSLVPGSEKAVNFTEFIEIFHTVSSDSVTNNIEVEQDSSEVRNEYYDLKPHSSSETKHIRGSIAQFLREQDETEQMMERKEGKLKEYKTSKYKIENIESGPEIGRSFIFPEVPQKPDTKLKSYVSSFELIKDTQEKLRLKAKEEEKKIKEGRERKAEEEKMKKLAREENLLEKAEELPKEAAIKVKRNLDQDSLKIEKYSSHKGEKMTKQTRPISGQEKKDVEESSKQVQPQKRSDKVTAANRFDQEKDKSIKSMTKQTRPISGQEKKDVEESSKQVEPQKRSDIVKTNRFDKEKDKSIKSMTKQTRPISEQEKKDVEESSKQAEPQKRSDKVKANGFDKEKDKPIKSMTKQTRPISEQEKKDVEESSKQVEPQKRSDKVKANGFDKEKDKSIKSMTKETHPISEQEKKDVEESSKQVEKQKRSDKAKANGFDKEKDKPIKSKTEEQKEKKLHSSVVKQLEQSKEKYDSGKTKKTGESELPTSDIKQLGKVKNIESENEQDAVKVKKPEEKDMISELTRKREGPSKSFAALEKKGDDMPLKERNKSQKSKSDKVEELKEGLKGLEEKRDALQPMEKDKFEKGNKLEDSKQKDVKMNEIKLLNASTDDLVLKLIKVNNKEPAKDTIKPKLPELSKLLLKTTKTKDKLVEKLTSAQAEAKKKDDKVDFPSKEKKEKELKINEVKLVENNMDDLILRLIQISQRPDRISDRGKMQPVKRKKRRRVGDTKTEPEVEEEESSEEFNTREEPTQERNRFGQGEPAPLRPPQREGQEMKPLYVKLKLSEISSSAPLKPVEEAQTATYDRKKDPLEMSKKKVVEPVDPDAGKGVIRYALSDRTFIEKGWTMLPVEKVVRKMNIYRMRPAQPEFDWFEHNKKKGLMLYDTGAKLAEFDNNGHGRWFYKNGRLALDYYEAEETNTQQRFVVYSNGELDERGRFHPITILATFDHLGNGVVFDHAGKIRLKYNQTEGVLLDRSVGPVTNWKWHSLNDPPVLQQVMIDTQMPLKDPKILKMGGPADNRTRPDNEEMLAIEFDNFIKEKSKKLTQKFKPFQIKLKALKINDKFSLKVLDQATIYLIFRDGSANLKLNIGMVLDHKEIVDTDTAELGEVSNSMEHFPARTDSLAALQHSVAYARRYERMRTERERKLRRPEPCISADNLGKAASRPLRPPLRTVPTGIISPSEASTMYCKCRRKPSSSLYYNTQLL